MPRAFLTSQRAFPVVMAITLAIAILPPAVMRLFQPIAEFQNVLLGPFAQFGNVVGGWIRPAVVTKNTPEVQELVRDRDEALRLYEREKQRVLELQGIIEQLQKAAY